VDRPLLIIAAVLRRVHVSRVYLGELVLDANEARHLRDVLRLEAGASVEAFDDAGNVATGVLIAIGRHLAVNVESLREPSPRAFELIIAAAVPKGERADWMIEKLSELGVAEFIPLAAARSVVLPEGKNKRERWMRIATEAAKQSRRSGVMRINELTNLQDVIRLIDATNHEVGWYFSTGGDARSIVTVVAKLQEIRSIVALIGPEGGWTDDELAAFANAGLTPVRLTGTVLRVETAAVAAAAVIESTVIRPS
jgi:16S rRNA (uracil1498-N3)-methyltransferase